MVSLPTSRLRFLTQAGAPLDGPREWERCLVELDFDPEELEQIRLVRQGVAMPVFAQQLAGATRLLAEWPLSGTGRYRLALEHAGEAVEESPLTIQPRKISADAYGRLIDDLQTELPASVAVGLQRTGALSGLELHPPGESTLAQELSRLRLAVEGKQALPGLAATLVAIARDPHRVLRKYEEWVDRERVRRLEPLGLVAALRQPNNLDPEARLPRRAPDVRVEQTVDVYENRLLGTFHDEVARRLRRLAAALEAQELYSTLVEAEELQEQLRRARHTATFLEEVGPLGNAPTTVSMVLMRRPEYRRMLESYLRFRRTAFVQLDEPALETPLEDLPDLYQLWGTLQVIKALLAVAHRNGFETRNQQLAKPVHDALYIKVLPGGRTAVELRNATTTVKLKPERSFGAAPREGLRSISFPQIPDIVVEIRREGRRPELLLFDPKYKLESEDSGEPGDGKPKKIDIDKMHAYRDAIRTEADERVVSYAATLYPGPEVRYGDGIEALSARPLDAETLRERLEEIFTRALVEVPTASTPGGAGASDADAVSALPGE